jgi:ComF family protein
MDLCSNCQRDLPYWKHGCHKCGAVLDGHEKICGNCLREIPSFDYTFAMCRYIAPIAKLILDLKFQHQLIHAKILGELMAKKLKHRSEKLPQCIIPVPLSRKRLRERGFNQALELAKPISKLLHVAIEINACERVKHTEAQAMLLAKHRHKNIKNAFVIKQNFNAKHVAIIDDVVTTGHTVRELSHVLRKNGVEVIEVWCCAKT